LTDFSRGENESGQTVVRPLCEAPSRRLAKPKLTAPPQYEARALRLYFFFLFAFFFFFMAMTGFLVGC